MRAVDQQLLCENGDVGDCLRACVASILDLDPEAVPHFVTKHHWFQALRSFGKQRQLEIFSILDPQLVPANQYTIATGSSPRNPERDHSVVWYQGKVFHDPHPSRAGLGREPDYWIVIERKC